MYIEEVATQNLTRFKDKLWV